MNHLIDLIQTDGGRLHRAAATHGGEFAGPCPFCGGKDRFRAWPVKGRYWCRSCGKAGDSIQYLRERRGLSFVEACRCLGHELGPRSNGGSPAPAAWQPREAKAPTELWQTRARAFLDRAINCLWSRRGESMRAWLHDAKGLSDTIIKKACLGLNPIDLFEQQRSWGLGLSLNSDLDGARAAAFWTANYKRAKRWPTIRGKDPAEAQLNRLDLLAWVQAGLCND